MYYAIEEILVKRVRYGLILKIGILLFVITFIQCSVSHFKKEFDFHLEESKPEQGVTMTVTTGIISAHTWTPENSNCHQVISDSSVIIEAEVKNAKGQIIFTYDCLHPGDSFWFYSEEPCLVIVSEST